MANDCIPAYEPGARITAKAKVALTGRRFVKFDSWAGPKYPTAAGADANIVVDVPAADAPNVFGVTQEDAAINKKVTILRGSGMVLPVEASAAITAGAAVGTDATGRAKVAAAGATLGYALIASAAAGDIIYVDLYH